MSAISQHELLEAIRADGRYPLAAYEFLQEGLQAATRQLFSSAGEDEPHHVSGQELCGALRDLALQRWGALAGTVLASWNVRRTRDFGEMVFFLIQLHLMAKQDSDELEDFDDVYDFREAFGGYEVPTDGVGE